MSLSVQGAICEHGIEIRLGKGFKETHARFRNTLFPAAGASTVETVFFPMARALLVVATFFLLSTAFVVMAALPPFLITVVPVDTLEILLILLTTRFSAGAFAIPLFGLVLAGLTVGFCWLALRSVTGFVRVFLVFSATKPASEAVGAVVADLVGDDCLIGTIALRGEAKGMLIIG